MVVILPLPCSCLCSCSCPCLCSCPYFCPLPLLLPQPLPLFMPVSLPLPLFLPLFMPLFLPLAPAFATAHASVPVPGLAFAPVSVHAPVLPLPRTCSSLHFHCHTATRTCIYPTLQKWIYGNLYLHFIFIFRTFHSKTFFLPEQIFF